MAVNQLCFIFITVLSMQLCEAEYLRPGSGASYLDLVSDAERLRQVIFKNLSDDSHSIRELRSGLLRQSFHDCVGGCDGCVDLTNPDNFRLDEAVNATAAWAALPEAGQLSQADVNALAGAVAAEIAINRNPPNFPVNIQFFPGRIDCPNRNNMPARIFPLPFSPTAFEDLKINFGLSNKEAVGLLGAHSIGEAEIESSGFGHFPWDEDEFTLDNEYYQELLELKDWKLKLLSNNIRNSSQWEDSTCSSCSHSGIFMLHADMGLLKDFQVSGEFNTPSCKLTDCPDRLSTALYVKLFARNNDAFIRTFITAFQKMITVLPNNARPVPKTGTKPSTGRTRGRFDITLPIQRSSSRTPRVRPETAGRRFQLSRTGTAGKGVPFSQRLHRLLENYDSVSRRTIERLLSNLNRDLGF